MMGDYTPTTDEVETAFHEFASQLETEQPGTYEDAPEFKGWQEAMAGFKRWLAAHDRKVAAKALRDAAERYNDETYPDSMRWNPLTAGSDDFEGILLRYAAECEEG